jgi:NOL1/NOP2/sun family putative RNA methylase
MQREIEFTDDFKQNLNDFLGEKKAELCMEAMKKQDKTIRVNTLKISKKELLDRLKNKLKLEAVNFYEYAFRVNNYPKEGLGNLMEHFFGYFYVQSLSSMLPVLVLNPKKNTKVLDLASAPGGKTSQIAQHMENTGLLLANDNNYSRISALVNNCSRLGVLNMVVTKRDGRSFRKPEFDKVLLDAPCSGDGSYSKKIKEWNEKKSRNFGELQRELLMSAFNSLKPGGELVYSTCTFSANENERVVSKVLKRFENAELQRIEIKGLNCSRGLKEYGEEMDKCLRIWPHEIQSEGFFIAKIKKVKE